MIVADLYAKLGLKVDKQSFSAGDKLIRGVKQGLVALGVFQGVRFFKNVIHDTIELGDNLGKLSAQLGVGTSALQELEFAAARSDLEFEQLTTGLRFLAKNAHAARSGNQELAKGFRQLGVTAAELKDQTPDELLMNVAEAFETMPTGQRVARAMQIFGKSGAALVPFLTKGPKGIAELRKEAQRLGLILDPGQVAQLEAADDELKTFSFVLRGIKSELALGLLPIVREYLGKLQDWIRNNRELISQRVRQFVDGVARAAEWLGQAFDFLVNNADEATLALQVFAGAWLAMKVAAVGAAVATAAAWAPVIAGLTAAAATIQVIRDFNNEETEGSVTSAVDDYQTRAARKGSLASRILNAPSDALADFFVQNDQDSAIGSSSFNPFRSGANRGANRRAENAAVDAAFSVRRPLGTPMVPRGASAAASSNTTINAPITVNAPNADPQAVAKVVGEKVAEMWRAAVPATQ